MNVLGTPYLTGGRQIGLSHFPLTAIVVEEPLTAAFHVARQEQPCLVCDVFTGDLPWDAAHSNFLSSHLSASIHSQLSVLQCLAVEYRSYLTVVA